MIPGLNLGRTLDPNYLPNRLIFLLTTGIGLAGGVYRLLVGEGLLASALWAVVAALTFFFSWVVARELDPDHDYAAFVAGFLALAGLLVFGTPSLLFLFWLPLSLRTINRTTGLPAGLLDAAGVLGFTGVLLYLGYWEVGLAAAAVFLLDAVLRPPLRRQFVSFFLTLILVLGISLIQPYNFSFNLPGPIVQAATLVIAIAFLPIIYLSRSLVSQGDFTGEPLVASRVQATQLLALLTGLLLVYSRGDAGFVFSLPLWAAMLGSAIFRPFFLVLKR